MRFRKKPVEVEAIQFQEPVSMEDVVAFCAGTPTPAHIVMVNGPIRLLIRTLSGYVGVSVGDWVIRGVKGECYPCKPDIFAATYEPVEGAP